MFTIDSSPRARIGVLVEQRYLGQAQPRGLVEALRRRAVASEVLIADRLPVELTRPTWAEGLELVVARGRSATLLALLRTLEAHGVPVLHEAASIAAVVDKAGMGAVLARAGIPSPRTWLATPEDLAGVSSLPFPLILKPLHGDNARGIRVVDDHAGLRGLAWDEPVALAQPFHRGDGRDVKLYVAGSHVWAVHRDSPIDVSGARRDDADPGRPIPVTSEMLALAAACQEAFGLVLFGIDCVEVDGRLLVIEVNEYPNYRGVSGDADAVLCDVVLESVRRPVAVGAGSEPVTAVAG